MKSRQIPFVLAVCTIATAHAFAALPDQPSVEPVVGDHGIYSVQEQSLGDDDPDLAKAYDNFSITGPGYELTGVSWTGIYAEPLPGAVSDVDFLVEIWGDLDGVPDLDAGPVLAKLFEDGNMIEEPGSDISVTGNGDVSPMTSTTPGGGPGADYVGVLPGIAPDSFSGSITLVPGDYWISIVAAQTFENPDPVIDPEWQWHLGAGPGDGFFSRDRTLDPAGTPEYGVKFDSGDLAFTLHGVAVPEPSSTLLAMLGMITAGVFRRRRS